MTALFRPMRPSRPATLVVAHRGHSAAAAENSVAALEQAIAVGADIVECDVRIAGDGVLVASHDADLKRLAGRAVVVADSPAAVLQAVARDAGAEVPPISDLMAAAWGRVPLMLDLKTGDPLVLRMIAETALAARFRPEDLVLGLRSPSQVGVAQLLLPDAVRLALHGPGAPAAAFVELGVRLVRLWETAVSAASIRSAAEHGCRVWVTTGGPGTGRQVGDADERALDALLRAGVSGLLVNDPGLGRRAVGRMAATA